MTWNTVIAKALFQRSDICAVASAAGRILPKPLSLSNHLKSHRRICSERVITPLSRPILPHSALEALLRLELDIEDCPGDKAQ